jgi:flagellar protein FlaG
MGLSFTLCEAGGAMKIGQTHLVSVGPASRPEGLGSASDVDRGESKKRVASEPQRERGSSIAQGRSKPIVLDYAQVRLRFNKDEDTGVQVIQVVDADSGKLVRQIPPEELLNIAKALREIKGLMVSKES